MQEGFAIYCRVFHCLASFNHINHLETYIATRMAQCAIMLRMKVGLVQLSCTFLLHEESAKILPTLWMHGCKQCQLVLKCL